MSSSLLESAWFSGMTRAGILRAFTIKNGYRLETLYKIRLSNSEVLTLCKILLDSRAFAKKEMQEMLDKLIICWVPKANLKRVKNLINNEEYHYVEPRHKANVLRILFLPDSFYL